MTPKTLYPTRPVLLVDDEASWLRTFSLMLRAAGVNNIETCSESGTVMDWLEANDCSVVALDLIMPEPSGEDLLAQITVEHPDLRVIIVSGMNDVGTAVRCLKKGAFDYFVKSSESARLVNDILRAVELVELAAENRALQQQLLHDDLADAAAFGDIITANKRMLGIFRYVEAVAATSWPVLVTGESGVGKELVARTIHRRSERQGEFVALNTAGLDDNLFSDTLFGHAKGGFTGADEFRSGMVEQAAGGTLFLDEIGDLSLASQVKLLRLLQNGEYFSLGSDSCRRAETRVLAATNRNLRELQGVGQFRKDLFYRLTTHWIDVPPLRQRKEDIPMLLEHFLGRAAEELQKTRPTPPPQLVHLLKTYYFPGNVRELESMVFDAVSRHQGGVLSMESFREHIQQNAADTVPAEVAEPEGIGMWATFSDPLPTLRQVTELLIDEAMERSGNNQSIASQLLGISRQALNQRLKNR